MNDRRHATTVTVKLTLDELDLVGNVVARDRDQLLDQLLGCDDNRTRLLTDEDARRVPLHQSILSKLEEACK